MTTQLQCGHSPKAVENVLSSAGLTLDTALQCGHSPKAVENSDSTY